MLSWFLFIQLAMLPPCPNSPNCVSSQAKNKKHYIKPFQVYQNPKQSIERLAQIIKAMPRTSIILQSTTELKAIFSSKIFGFKDDVEFLYNKERHVIDVRSASKLGYWDLGVNRKRIEAIRNQYIKH